MQATSECRRVGHCGEELEEQCTYLGLLGLVAASAATLAFELQILILLVTMWKKLSVIHFCLDSLQYDDSDKSIYECEIMIRHFERMKVTASTNKRGEIISTGVPIPNNVLWRTSPSFKGPRAMTNAVM